MTELRTVDEMLDFVKHNRDFDQFGIIAGNIFAFIKYEHVKPFLKEGVTEKSWSLAYTEYNSENVITKLRYYIPFAIDKALNDGGIRAVRSIYHLCSWMWLLKDDELYTYIIDEKNYGDRGLPILDRVVRKYYPEMGKYLEDYRRTLQ